MKPFVRCFVFLPCVWICVSPAHTCEMKTQAQMQTHEMKKKITISCVFPCVSISVEVVHTCISLRLHLRRTCELGLRQILFKNSSKSSLICKNAVT